MENEILLQKSYNVEGGNFENAGEVSTNIKSILVELGVDPQVIRRLIICAFEAEMNIVMYADKGTVNFSITPDKIRLNFDDKGQGIEDIEQAMQEGYSMASDELRERGFGAGQGLPNIKKNADDMKLTSMFGKGTSLKLSVNL